MNKIPKICSFCGETKTGGYYENNFYCGKHLQRIYHHGTPYRLGRQVKSKFFLNGDICKVVTSRGFEFIVDAKDYELVSTHSWSIYNGYPVARIDHKTVKVSRLILNVKDSGILVDHINGNPLDSRRINLRTCNKMQNVWNCKTGKNNTSGYTGVQFEKRNNKWIATIVAKGERKWLGTFETKEEAAKARRNAEIELLGEFAPHNRNENPEEII